MNILEPNILSAEAVLFDLDGTLIDSMSFHADAWAAALKDVGLSFDRQKFFALEGTSVMELAALYLNSASEAECKHLVSLKEAKLSSLTEGAPFAVYPGAKEILVELRARGIALGIVTAGSRERVLATLSDEILDFFDCIVCGDDGLPGKPAPDPYLKGRELLGVDANCLVFGVENAPLGVKSLIAANCVPIVILSSCPPSAFDFASPVIYHPSLASLAVEVRNFSDG